MLCCHDLCIIIVTARQISYTIYLTKKVRNVALLSKEDREVLFSRTAEKMKMHPSIVEKDFWVCFMLDHLFHDCIYKDAFVFNL